MIRHLPWFLIGLLLLFADSVIADTLATARPVRAGDPLRPGDVVVAATPTPGAMTDLSAALRLEASRNLYPGQPLFRSDLQEPRMVERNQIVSLSFEDRGLRIVTEGRALDSGAVGDTIRILNSSSRNTVSGTILSDGTVSVTRSDP